MLMRHSAILIYSALFVLFFAAYSDAENVTKRVKGEGQAMVTGITTEQAQYRALQRARAAAIEEAAGIKITGTTLVKSGFLIAEYIKSFSHGYIVDERQEWSSEFIADEDGPGIPSYTVEIEATVVIPEKKVDSGFFFRSAELNREVFFTGDNCVISGEISRKAHIAVFNMMADNMIEMVYPTKKLGSKKIFQEDYSFLFPPPDSGTLRMATLKDHERDTEAFIVVAVPVREDNQFRFEDFFSEDKTYSVPEFFSAYSRFADNAIEKILPYEVRVKESSKQ